MQTAKFDYVIAMWIIMLSGNPLLVPNKWRDAIVLATTFAILLIHKDFLKKIFGNIGLLIFCAIFLLIFMVQAIDFNFLSLQTVASFYIRLLLGFALFRVISSGPEKYIQCLCLICLISLAFFIPSEALRLYSGTNLRSMFESFKFLSGNADILHLVFYNFDGAGEPNRNSGPFWEPGAFSGYILIAILLLSQYKNVLSKKSYWMQLIIMVATLLSTKSTTGYLLLPLSLIPHININLQRNIKMLGFRMLVATTVMLAVASLSPKVMQLDFLGEKIYAQYKLALDKEYLWEISRFGNFLFDLQYIEKKPVFGWGINEKTRYSLHGGREIPGQGNGLTDTVGRFGFTGFLTFSVFLFISFRRFYDGNTKRVAVSLLLVMLALNAEKFLNFPVFLGLIALPRAPNLK